MCGLTGIFNAAGLAASDCTTVRTMCDTLAHRGPDASDTWVDEGAGIALGQRRLAVVDLSPAGAQPMHSSNGRWVTVYNGELYNTEDLRKEIALTGNAINWRGHSDTEVILEAVSIWGVENAVTKFNGIFAMALWDRQTRKIWLIRDRIGIKPLYWTALDDGTLLFGSELRALRSHPRFPRAINADAVADFLHSACIGFGRSIYQGVHKVEPAHIVTFSGRQPPTTSCYWDLTSIAENGQAQLDRRPVREVTDDLEALLRDAVGRQMVADVPLGAFLSGGIDSSLVVALMQAQSSEPVRTYAIGFNETRFDESPHARRVAQHLGTRHTELIVDPETLLATIPLLPDVYDEPFADSSQIPTYLVSKLARRDLTVSLSGDGGDECFGGYTRYYWVDRMVRWTTPVPATLRRGVSSAIRALSTDAWETLLSPIPPGKRPTHLGDKIHKGAALLPFTGVDAMYGAVVSQWPEPLMAMSAAMRPATDFASNRARTTLRDPVARMRYFDMCHYLPDDILTKVDRASMAVSLEARVPLLDHRVIEYSWRMPRDMLFDDKGGKSILRNILARYLPPAYWERKKMGFGIPLGEWMRGPLADWTHDLLSEQSLGASGLFDVAYVRRHLNEHMSGKRNWQYALWTIIQFQAWHRRWA